MKLNSHIISHPQGSEAWAQHRAASLNASDLAAAMGLSKYQTRNDVIKRLATGITPEVDAMTQARFDKGHANEAAAEPKASEVIGEELYPMVLAATVPGLTRKMSASFDGLTLLQDVSWENKSPNADLVKSVQAGVIPVEYQPQMEQGLMLSGAGKCLFTVSDGEVFVSAWYESDPELRAKIIPTWQQIEADVAAYVPPMAAAVEKIVAEPVEALPAPVVQVTGQIALQDNFKAFEARLREFLDNKLIREPKSDQDFADLDGQIKAMKAARESLKAAGAQMLAQVEPIQIATNHQKALDALLQQNVSMAEKLLTAEKERRKGEIVAGGVAALKAHIDGLNTRLGKPYMPVIPADFGGAVRGLKSLTSMEDKVSGELARAKIHANQVADGIDANLRFLREHATEYRALFADTAQLVLKPADDFQALVRGRIAEHQAAVQREADAAAERARAKIREEEQARAEKEARDKLAAEQAEAKRLADEHAAREAETARQAAAAELAAAKDNPDGAELSPAAQALHEQEGAARLKAVHPALANVVPLTRPTAPPADNGARVKLGDINAAIAPLSITADGLAALGFPHVATDKSAKLYRAADRPAIYAAMVAHIEAVQAKQAA